MSREGNDHQLKKLLTVEQNSPCQHLRKCRLRFGYKGLTFGPDGIISSLATEFGFSFALVLFLVLCSKVMEQIGKDQSL